MEGSQGRIYFVSIMKALLRSNELNWSIVCGFRGFEFVIKFGREPVPEQEDIIRITNDW